MKILFRHVDILVRTKKGYKTLHNAFLGVNEDKIDYIGEADPDQKYDVIKDLDHHLLIPGLVNGHGHSAMTLLRGVGSGLKLQDWLNDAIFPIEAKLTPHDVEIGTKLAIMEMLACGTTCFSDMYDFPYAIARGVAKSGIRANICRTGLCFEDVDMKDHVRYHECIDVANNLSGNYSPNEEIKRELGTDDLPEIVKNAVESGLIRGDLSCHSEYLTKPKFVKETAKSNQKLQHSVQIHVAETKQETEDCKNRYSLTPIQYFYKQGILDGGFTYCAHCNYCDEKDLKIMAKTNTSLITNPSSNMKLASGFAPIRKALDLGVNVGLGTDGCASNNNLDMFEEMHVLALTQAGYYQNPGQLSTTEIFDMATIGSAKAMHRDDIGRLEVGYKADVVAINLNKPHLKPNLDTLSLLVYSAHGSDVDMTMVNGKILYENGKFLTLDYEEIINESQKIVDRLYKK